MQEKFSELFRIYSFISAFFLCASPLQANIGPQGFGEFVQNYFVETGTFSGDGIQKALDAGFQEIRSIEYTQNLCEGARRRFKGNSHVKIFQGDSAKMLWKVIKPIDQRITFWLDAHVYPPIKDRKNCPLIEELEQIKMHPIKTHTLLIDDMHCCGTLAFDGLTKEDLMEKIREINPDYRIYFIPGGDDGEYPENVMVAVID